MNTAKMTIALLGLAAVASFFSRVSLAFRLTLGGIFTFVLLLIFFPGIAALLAFLAAGTWGLYGGCGGLRRGSIAINARVRFMVYTREANPAEFWFYVLFFIVGGLAIGAWAIYFAFHYPIYHLS